MLTQLPLNSTTVTLDRNQNGQFNVYLAGDRIGSFEMFSVYGLTAAQYQSAIALGLDVSDECYMIGGQIFITQAQAAAQLVADRLRATSAWKMPQSV